MAFLDNSGDIILDAVLTDAGRKRLARGDGTFKVTQYTFGDDEIDYGSYNAGALSGSAYFDLEILQTPILEAFTNNRSSLKSKLITLTNNNLLFLPQIVLNEVGPQTQRAADDWYGAGVFLAPVNVATSVALTDAGVEKYLKSADTAGRSNYIRVDQGLNTNKLDPVNRLSSELTERQYMIQIDNRLATLVDVFSATQGSPSFLDDDQIATYYLTQGVSTYIVDCLTGQVTDGSSPNYVGAGFDLGESGGNELLQGPRGTKLRFSLLASSNLKASDYLFDTIGGTVTDSGIDFKTIDTTIKVTGITTGYSIDIPVRFLKKNPAPC